MSLEVFKNNMLTYMQNQDGIQSFGDFANKLTTEYDLLVRRSYQTVNNVNVLQTNTELMETMVNLALAEALQKRKGTHTIINELGKGIVAYWTGATLNNLPVPTIPAQGAFQNIQTTSALVTNPGTFPEIGPQIPTDNSGIFLDLLISSIQVHLLSIEGVYNTISLYPGFPTVPPSPGILLWKGFTVQPATRTIPSVPDTVIPVLPSGPDTLDDEQIAAKEEELKEAEAVVNDTSLPVNGRNTAKDYSNLLRKEISTKQINATPLDIGITELDNLSENIDDVYDCPEGREVVNIAKLDLGILEAGSPPGLNYGGFRDGSIQKRPGRIDEMFTNVGLDNQEKVQRTGSGYYWCAAAVATWWKEAGLPIPNGGASCDNWLNWARDNGYFSQQPKIGAAVLYGSLSDAHHIGIVSSVLPNGKIITIEGNTSGGGFNRNGVGVFTKSPKNYIGFVIPPTCSG